MLFSSLHENIVSSVSRIHNLTAEANLLTSSSTHTAVGMNVFIYVVVFLAAVSKVSLSLPSQSFMIHDRSDSNPVVLDGPTYNHMRQARSAAALPSEQQANQPRKDAEVFNTLRQLLVRLISRKGMPYQSRSPIASRASGLAPEHRIKDRDYEGWMDFGRRSAEAFEYS